MNKPIWKSKTMLGFGLAALLAVGQLFGFAPAMSTVSQLVQLLSALFGVFGLRDALK